MLIHVLFGTIEQNQFKIKHTDFFSLAQHFISCKNPKYFKELVAFLVRFLEHALFTTAERGYSNIDILRYKSKFKNADEESGEKNALFKSVCLES